MSLADGDAWEQEHVCLIRDDDNRICVKAIYHTGNHRDPSGFEWLPDPLTDAARFQLAHRGRHDHTD